MFVVSDAVAAPLSNAGVGLVSTSLRTRTALDGRYAISNLAPGRYVVRAQLVGYAVRLDTVVVGAGQTVTADFRLRAVSVTLDQVVVVGYGTQKRSDLTGSVTSVVPNVEQTPTPSLEQTLQGTAPGGASHAGVVGAGWWDVDPHPRRFVGQRQ